MNAERVVEKHPFTPFLPNGAKVVLCGTFPPKKEKWAMDFFYPNYYNDMWRIFGLLYFNDKEYFFNPTEKRIDKEGIKELLELHHIAIGETVKEAIRQKDNASDKFLEIVTPVNLPSLFEKIPECEALATTGEKAASIIAGLTDSKIPKMGEYIDCVINKGLPNQRKFQHWRLPSTSRAFPMKLEKKAEFYGTMLSSFYLL